MTDVWGANTFLVRKYNSRTFHLKVRRSRLFRFFRRFPQINVGGDSARIPFLEHASRESRVALPPKGRLRHSFSSNNCKLDQDNYLIIPIHLIHTYAQSNHSQTLISYKTIHWISSSTSSLFKQALCTSKQITTLKLKFKELKHKSWNLNDINHKITENKLKCSECKNLNVLLLLWLIFIKIQCGAADESYISCSGSMTGVASSGIGAGARDGFGIISGEVSSSRAIGTPASKSKGSGGVSSSSPSTGAGSGSSGTGSWAAEAPPPEEEEGWSPG